MFPSIVVSGGVHSKNLRKGDGECLRASVAISTLSTSEGRGKKQGGVVYTNTTFPIAFSSCLAIEVTAYGTANTQNNLRVTANSNTGFSFYTNDYTPRYLAVGY